jgi:hypothetical protein
MHATPRVYSPFDGSTDARLSATRSSRGLVRPVRGGLLVDIVARLVPVPTDLLDAYSSRAPDLSGLRRRDMGTDTGTHRVSGRRHDHDAA